jgi:site-specific recombinase XerD
MLLQFARKRLHKAPSALALEDIDAPLVTAFLDDLEASRGITARTRNLRLTAVHSFFRFASYEAPTHGAQIARVLAIPAKKFTRALVPFLSRPEVDALLAAPDLRTWSGRRDHALMLVAVQTGLRLSELTGMRRDDVVLGAGSHVRVIGKGRKERCTPLSKASRAVMAAWMGEPPRAPDQHGRRQLRSPPGDNYPVRLEAGEFVEGVAWLVCWLGLLSTAVWQAKRVRP